MLHYIQLVIYPLEINPNGSILDLGSLDPRRGALLILERLIVHAGRVVSMNQSNLFLVLD